MLYSSSITWASSTRSSESMSRSSKRESGFTFSGSSPNSTSAEVTLSLTWSLVAVVIWVSFRVGSGGHAAVDGQYGPVDVGGLIGGEEADARGDVLWCAGTPRRDRGEQACAAVGGDLARQLGLDQAGRDGVHRDAAARDLRGDGAGQCHQPRLR